MIKDHRDPINRFSWFQIEQSLNDIVLRSEMMTSFVSISALSTLEKLMNLIFCRIKCGITIICYMTKRKKKKESKIKYIN